jgi:hypothetical protein
LPAGAYTAILEGKEGGTGVGLVEVYDLDPKANSTLGNISRRGFVDIADNVMIGGFITGSGEGVLDRAIVRALGPSLAAQGIADPLEDPDLELHDQNGAIVRGTNDTVGVGLVEVFDLH